MKRKSLKGAWAFALALLLIGSFTFSAFASDESTDTAFPPPLNENIGDTLITHIKNFGNAFKSQFSEFSYDVEKTHEGSKNLFVYPYRIPFPYTKNGVTFTENTDYSISVTGTATQQTNITLTNLIFLSSGVYTLSGSLNSSCWISFSVVADDGSFVKWYTESGKGFTFSVPDGGQNYIFCLNIASGYTCDNVTFYPMLVSGDSVSSYEPYLIDKYLPTASFVCLVTFVCIGLVLSILIIIFNYIFGGNKKI